MRPASCENEKYRKCPFLQGAACTFINWRGMRHAHGSCEAGEGGICHIQKKTMHWAIHFFAQALNLHLAVRRILRKPPLTRVTCWRTNYFYAEIVKRLPTRPGLSLIQVNTTLELIKWPLQSIAIYIWMHFCPRVIRCLKVGTYISNKGLT